MFEEPAWRFELIHFPDAGDRCQRGRGLQSRATAPGLSETSIIPIVRRERLIKGESNGKEQDNQYITERAQLVQRLA